MARDRTGEERDEQPTATDTKPVCAKCGDAVVLNTFHDDTPVLVDRSARLCASCWIPALRRRMNGETLDSRCTVPGCDLEVRDHVEHCKRIATSATWQARFASRRSSPAQPSSAEAATDRLAEAERQIQALREWTERERMPWKPDA